MLFLTLFKKHKKCLHFRCRCEGMKVKHSAEGGWTGWGSISAGLVQRLTTRDRNFPALRILTHLSPPITAPYYFPSFASLRNFKCDKFWRENCKIQKRKNIAYEIKSLGGLFFVNILLDWNSPISHHHLLTSPPPSFVVVLNDPRTCNNPSTGSILFALLLQEYSQGLIIHI